MNEVVGKASVQITPDLSKFGDDLKAKLQEAMAGTDQTTHDEETLKLGVDDTAYYPKLDEAKAKADELGAKRETVHVDVDENKLTSIFDRFSAKFDELGKNVTTALENISGGADGLHKSLTAAGDSASSAGEGIGGILAPAILTLGSAITPLVGVTTGFAIALAGVGTAAAAGLGGFAIAAYPVIKQVMTAYTQIAADQAALKRATSATAQNTALIHLKNDIAGLPPGIATLLEAVEKVKSAFSSWDQQFQGPVLQVLTDALKLAVPLMAAFTPLIVGGTQAVGQLVQTLNSGLQQSDFKQFMVWLGAEAPAALNSVVVGLMNFMGAISKMMEGFTPYMHTIEAGYINLTGAMEKFSTSKSFHDFVEYVIREAPIVGSFLKDMFGALGSTLVQLAPVGQEVLKVLDDIFKGITALNTVLPNGSIGIALFAVGSVLALGLVGKGLKTLEEGWTTGIDHMKGTWHFFADDVDAKGTNIRKIFKGIGDAYESVGNRMKAIGNGLVSAFNWIKNLITGKIVAETAETEIQASMERTAVVAQEVSTSVQGSFDELAAAFQASGGQMALFGDEVGVAFTEMGAAAEAEAGVVEEATLGVIGSIRARIAAMMQLRTANEEGFISLEMFGGGEAVVAGETGALAVAMDAEAASADAGAVSTGIFSGAIDFLTGAFAALDISTGGLLLAIGALVVGAIYVATHWKQVWGEVVRIFHDVVGFVKNDSLLIAGGLLLVLGPIALIPIALMELALHWKAVWHGILVVVDDVVSWLKSHLALVEIFAPFLAIVILIAEHWKTVWHDVMAVFDVVVNFIRSHMTIVVAALAIILGPIAVIIAAVVELALHWKQAWGLIVDAVRDGWKLVQDIFVTIPEKVIHYFVDAGKWLINAGKDIIGGLIHGAITAPLNGLEDVGKKIIGGFRSALSWFSPPPWTIQAGTDIMGGFTKGIQGGSEQTVAAAKNVSKQIIDAFGSLANIKTDAAAVGGLKSIFDNLNGVFTSVATAGQGADAATASLGSIKTAVARMDDVIKAMSGMPSVDGLADKARGVGTAISDMGTTFKNVSFGAVNSTLVTEGALQGIINSVEMLKTRLPWLIAGIDAIGVKLRDTSKPVQVTNWAQKFFDAIGKLFVAFSHPGANWVLVSKDAVTDVVGSLLELRIGMIWLDKGIVDLGGTLQHNAPHPIKTLDWAVKYFDAIDKLFVAFSHVGADWVLVSKDAVADAVGAILELRIGMIWLDQGIEDLGGTLQHNAPHPIKTLDWAVKYFDAIDKLFVAFSHPGADWVLVSKDAVADVVGSILELRIGMIWLDQGIEDLGGTLQHNAQHPVKTMQWADDYFTAVDKLFKAFSHPGADWVLVSTGAVTGVVGSVANLVLGTKLITAGLNQISDDLGTAQAPVNTMHWLGQLFDAMAIMFVKAGAAASTAGAANSTALGAITLGIVNITSAMNKLPAAIQAAGKPALDAMKTAVTNLTALLATLNTAWNVTWDTMPKHVTDMWAATNPTIKQIDNSGLTVMGTAVTNLGVTWGNTFTMMTKATTDMWTAIQPILAHMDAALVTTAADFLTVGSVSSPSVSSANATTGQSSTNRSTGSVTVEAAITPTIIIQGSGLSEAALSGAVQQAMTQSNQELIALLNAHGS